MAAATSLILSDIVDFKLGCGSKKNGTILILKPKLVSALKNTEPYRHTPLSCKLWIGSYSINYRIVHFVNLPGGTGAMVFKAPMFTNTNILG